jgi:DNA (cytosine-5)-methyltransferase 1
LVLDAVPTLQQGLATTEVLMNELALFAGAGGGILASKLLGWRTVCAVEIDRHRRSILLARQNDGTLEPFPIWDDIKTFDGRPWRSFVDVVSATFPCQSTSSAARGRNVAEHLWSESLRVVADVAPPYVRAENPSRAAIHAAAEDLAALGYTVRCIPLAARDLGADHIRPRHWLFAHANGHRELRGAFNAEVAELSRLCAGVWRTEPHEPRVADGVADRMDRLKATGEGEVPIVAAAAWRLLSV